MEPTPLSGGRGAREAASTHDQQQGQQTHELRANEGQKRLDHARVTAEKLNW
jgi:hypothetical protein